MHKNHQSHIIIHPYPPSPPPEITPYFTYFDNLIRTIDLSMLKNCLHSYVFIWTKSEGSFWMYPTLHVPDDNISGYQWDRHFWKFVKIDYGKIAGFF